MGASRGKEKSSKTSLLTPHTSDLPPHTSRLTPHMSHLTPHTSHLAPHASLLTSHTSHITPHTSCLEPHTLHLAPQTSKPPPETSDVTAHTSQPTTHTSHLTPLIFLFFEIDSGEGRAILLYRRQESKCYYKNYAHESRCQLLVQKYLLRCGSINFRWSKYAPSLQTPHFSKVSHHTLNLNPLL